MAYFQQYQSAPGWGTNQFQAMPPPAPSWQPQPGWGGMDYYRAYAGAADSSPYEYAWNRVRNYSGAATFGVTEAKMLHRRAYGGLGDIMVMPPNEIGAAAAYEVFRTWRYHYGIIAQPLSGDRERQREALVGLAVGEATRLWEYTNRLTDQAGRLAAVESAAVTASQIFAQAQQMALVSGGVVGAGAVAGMGMGMDAGMVPGGYGGGGGMNMNMNMNNMNPTGVLTPIGSPMGLAGGMGLPGAGMGMGMGGGMGGGYGGYGANTLPPPFTRQRSLSMGAAPFTPLGVGMGMPGGISPGLSPGIAGGPGGGGGYFPQGATAGGMMGYAPRLGEGAYPGGGGGVGGAYGAYGAGGLQRSRSFTSLNGGGAGYAPGYAGSGGGGYAGMGGGNSNGLTGALAGSYAAPAAAYAQGTLGPMGALGEEALARHERHEERRRRRRRNSSGGHRSRRHHHHHGLGEGLAEAVGGYEAGGYGPGAGYGGAGGYGGYGGYGGGMPQAGYGAPGSVGYGGF